jgi:hypothetical protein
MRSLFRFLYRAEHRETSEKPLAVEMLGGSDKAPEHFSVKWVVHRYETLAVEVENSALQNLDKIVESCRSRLRRCDASIPTHRPMVFSYSMAPATNCDAGSDRLAHQCRPLATWKARSILSDDRSFMGRAIVADQVPRLAVVAEYCRSTIYRLVQVVVGGR